MGWRDGRYFVIMAGLGYDAFVLGEALRRAKAGGRKVGFLDYVIAATLGARRYPFPRLLIESREWSGNGAFAFVANCARYGANMRMAPRARLDDPALELVVMPEGQFVQRVRYLVAILAGTLDRIPGVVMRRVEEVSIRAGDSAEAPCQLDGEVAQPLPALIRAVPGALHLLRTGRGQ
jgi:diacylglycerol kinase family enzyme